MTEPLDPISRGRVEPADVLRELRNRVDDHDTLLAQILVDIADLDSRVTVLEGLVGSGGFPTRTMTSSGPVTNADRVLLLDASSGALNASLADATTFDEGVKYTFKKIDSSANYATVLPFGGQTIDGDSFLSITEQYTSVDLIRVGSVWYIV